MSIRNQLNGTTPQGLSLQGQPGPNFENEGQRTTSNIQALANSNALQASQDLLTGRVQGSFLVLNQILQCLYRITLLVDLTIHL